MMAKSELSAMDACQQLGVSLDYLYRLLYAGKLPGRKVDGMWRIPVSAIEARRLKCRRQEVTR
jgi:excisionase family DNA binding protein